LVHRIEPRPAIFVLRVLFRMNAIDRAGVHACSVFRSDAGFGNDKGPGALPKTAYLQLYHTGIAAAAPDMQEHRNRVNSQEWTNCHARCSNTSSPWAPILLISLLCLSEISN
jgi:hypothetical protein